jgi:transcriptional regulator with XRE-family HTH domain
MIPESSIVATWELGLRLKEKRDLLDLRVADVHAATGISVAYLAAVEKGKKVIAEDKLRAVAKVLEFDEATVAEMVVLRERAHVRGWWTKYSALFDAELVRFFGFEHGAESIRSYNSGVIYGLLQTERYARAIIEAGAPNVRLAEVDRRVQARMTRQRRLFERDSPQIISVMSEAALRQQIGGPEVLAEQLRFLEKLITDQTEKIEIRVVPFTATGHDALGGSNFHILAFPGGDLPTLVWQETVTSTGLIEDSQMTREFAFAHAVAAQHALNRVGSVKLIKDLAKELE